MSTVLFNPTNEKLSTQYIGEDVTVLPYPEKGHILKVDDARARHVLNVLGPRGLCSLSYGDDENKKNEVATNGILRNKAFKRKMVVEFNQHNQANEQRNLPQLVPTPLLIKYANELGTGLIEPYTTGDAERNEIGVLKAEQERNVLELRKRDEEIEQFKGQVSALTEQVAQLIETFKQPSINDTDVVDPSTEKVVESVSTKTGKKKSKKVAKKESSSKAAIILDELKTMDKVGFDFWLEKNEKIYNDFTLDEQEEIKMIFAYHNPGENFPL
ncbi:MAG: hypothetical protein JJV89_02005 [Desulfosarcina sp.]|nr:hypothetical protein [Desulfobacterales bacterium]